MRDGGTVLEDFLTDNSVGVAGVNCLTGPVGGLRGGGGWGGGGAAGAVRAHRGWEDGVR